MMRNAPHSGIAIGPILMIVALIAVIVGAFSMGSSDIGGAMRADQATAELRAQADQIRAKIQECVFITRQYATVALQADPVTGIMPADTRSDLQKGYGWPGEGGLLGTAINVRDLDCPRDPTGRQNLWTGMRPSTFPAAPSGFDNWVFVNHGDPRAVNPGGTCIRIQPQAATAADGRIREAITKALRGLAPDEYTYNPGSSDQMIIIWLRRPQSGTAC